MIYFRGNRPSFHVFVKEADILSFFLGISEEKVFVTVLSRGVSGARSIDHRRSFSTEEEADRDAGFYTGARHCQSRMRARDYSARC